MFLHDSGYGAEKRNSPPAPSRLFLLCRSQIRHGIDIKMLLRGRRDGMHQLWVGPHDLPSAHIAILRQQLPIHSGREDRGDGKAPLKLASPYAAGFLLPCFNQPVQGLHAKERLVPGEE